MQYIAAIDVETTGPDPEKHEITQIGIIIANRWLEIDPKFTPLQMFIAPNNPDFADKEALLVQSEGDPHFDKNKYLLSRNELITRLQNGLTSDNAAYLLEDWFTNLKLPPKTRIIPLAHNWVFDRQFLIKWLGPMSFSEIFDSRYRDTMAIAGYLNDKETYHSNTLLFNNLKLNNLALKLGYVPECAHSAFDDCRTTIEVYKRLMVNTFSGNM